MDDHPPAIELLYDCTDAEREEASVVLTAKGDAKVVASTGSRKGKGLVGWVLFIGLAVVLIFMLHEPGRSTTARRTAPSAPWPIDVWIALGCFGFGILSGVLGHASFRLARRERRNLLRGKVRYRFDEVAVTHDRPGRRDTLAWDRFCGFDESANLFVLRYSPKEGLVFPKRLLDQEGQQRLRSLLQEKVVRPAIPLSLGFPVTHT